MPCATKAVTFRLFLNVYYFFVFEQGKCFLAIKVMFFAEYKKLITYTQTLCEELSFCEKYVRYVRWRKFITADPICVMFAKRMLFE